MKSKVSVYNVKSGAKINIGLRVLSKRKDGYHNIETIFYPVKIQDKLEIKIRNLPEKFKSNLIKVSTSSNLRIGNKKNICYKAAELFFEKFVITSKNEVLIKIDKKIPAGAGLGGGSGNAATVLSVLMKHFEKEISGFSQIRKNRILNNISLMLGSDVPFFLAGDKAAYGTGRGEKLKQIPGFKIRDKILIVNPGIHVSTPLAYKDLKIRESKRKILDKSIKFDTQDERLMINDFERVVFKKHPEIERIKIDILKLGASFALMSGSGSSVYGIFKKKDLSGTLNYFKRKGFKVFAG